jgi:hypothetical protein
MKSIRDAFLSQSGIDSMPCFSINSPARRPAG